MPPNYLAHSRWHGLGQRCGKREHSSPTHNLSQALTAGLPAKFSWVQLRRQASNSWFSKWQRKVSHARMSQLCQQSMILAVICSPLKHWPHPVLSSSSHLLQLLLSSYISHHLTNANSEPGTFVFFLWKMSYLALFGAKILAICLLKLLFDTLEICVIWLVSFSSQKRAEKAFSLGGRVCFMTSWWLAPSVLNFLQKKV